MSSGLWQLASCIYFAISAVLAWKCIGLARDQGKPLHDGYFCGVLCLVVFFWPLVVIASAVDKYLNFLAKRF